MVVSDISLEDCQKVADEIKKIGGETMAIKCDVSQRKEIEEVVKETSERWGKIDVLVNNAGICQFKPFLELTEEEWQKTLDINLKGYFLTAQACAREMVKKKSGCIINIASIAMGQLGVGFPNLAHYSASKGGIVAMIEILALELAPHNIRVNAISPRAIETPMIDPLKIDSKTTEGILARIPMRRLGKPEEVSHLVLFLASEAASYITGANFIVDCGWLAT